MLMYHLKQTVCIPQLSFVNLSSIMTLLCWMVYDKRSMQNMNKMEDIETIAKHSVENASCHVTVINDTTFALE